MYHISTSSSRNLVTQTSMAFTRRKDTGHGFATAFLLNVTLLSADELTFTQPGIFSQSLLSKGGFHTRSNVSSRCCSPLIYRVCTSALRHSAGVPTISAPLHLQNTSQPPHISILHILAGSNRNRAGHINRGRTSRLARQP